MNLISQKFIKFLTGMALVYKIADDLPYSQYFSF